MNFSSPFDIVLKLLPDILRHQEHNFEKDQKFFEKEKENLEKEIDILIDKHIHSIKYLEDEKIKNQIQLEHESQIKNTATKNYYPDLIDLFKYENQLLRTIKGKIYKTKYSKKDSEDSSNNNDITNLQFYKDLFSIENKNIAWKIEINKQKEPMNWYYNICSLIDVYSNNQKVNTLITKKDFCNELPKPDRKNYINNKFYD